MAMDVHTEYQTSMDSKYYLKAGQIGAPTRPDTANQITQLGNLLNQGIKNIEIGTLDPKIFETIPRQHFKEMERIGKLTGATISVHAPVQNFDITGFTDRGWDEFQRQTNEKRLAETLDRVSELDPKGNVLVTVHGGSTGAYQWQKGIEGEKAVMGIVNRDSGQVQAVKYEKKIYPGKEEAWTPEMALESLNETEWREKKLKIQTNLKDIRELNERFERVKKENEILELGHKKNVLSREEEAQFQNNLQNKQILEQHIGELNHHIRNTFMNMYNDFSKFANEEDKKHMLAQPGFNEALSTVISIGNKQGEIANRQREIAKQYREARSAEEREHLAKEFEGLGNDSSKLREVEMQPIISLSSALPAPNTWVPLDDFAIEKGSQTVANAAFEVFKKHREKAPVICVENVYPEMPLSRAESLKEMIEEAREKFSKRLVKELDLDKSRADLTAEKLIGATWDLGHINLLKRGGFTKEDILKETKEIRPFVKKVHITDNFGFDDTHLPPGMGNVDTLNLMQELEKGGRLPAIIEAGGFAQAFEQSPMLEQLQALGSPLYSIDAPPYWHEIAYHPAGPYSMGYGPILPKQHFDLYGAGFSSTSLPLELGGEIGTERGRLAAGGQQREEG